MKLKLTLLAVATSLPLHVNAAVVSGINNSFDGTDGLANNYGGVSSLTGESNTVNNSVGSNILGYGNTINNSGYALLEGNNNTIDTGVDSVTLGNWNTNTGSSTDVRGVIVGHGNTLTDAQNGVVIGSFSTATDKGSIVLGSESSASNGAVAIGDKSIGDRANTVSFGSEGNERQLVNVAAGIAETDAVNVSQLNQKAAAAISSANSYTDQKAASTLGLANAYTDKKVENTKNELNINIKNSKAEAINTSKSYTDSKYQQNVNYTDNKFEQSINYTQSSVAQAEQNAMDYTDGKFNQLNSTSNQRYKQLDDKINKAEKRLNAGVAGVTAIASIPYVAENNFSYGIGLGNYQNGNALAAGAQYKTTPNTNVRLNISWDSSSNSALGVGFAGGW